MAQIKIPTRNDFPSYSQRIELEGVIYNLSFRFNERMNRWIMDIQDQEENDILIGIVMLTSVPLLQQYIKEGLPPGDFILLHRDGTDTNAGRFDLGDAVQLFYAESGDLV